MDWRKEAKRKRMEHEYQQRAEGQINSENDYEKHVQAFSNHFHGLYGEGWEEMSMMEAVKLLAHKSLGLNGGSVVNLPDAADQVGFEPHNVVAAGDGTFHVLALIEFMPEHDGET